MKDAPLLSLRDLSISYRGPSGRLPTVRSVDLDVRPGEIVALVGESGSGKSTIAHAVTGLLPPGARVDGGAITFGGLDLARLPERAFRQVRGARIGFVPQDPGVALNPVQRIGAQVAEALVVHGLAGRRTARGEAVALLDRAGLPDPAVRARQYPHELSGGMRQRVLIAMAIAARPDLIVADEPTSALDPTVQKVILDHFTRLAAESGTAVLLITHDLGVAADRAHRTAVMARGELAETGPTARVLTDPRAPATRDLLAATLVPDSPPKPPPASGGAPLLVAEGLVKEFRLGKAPVRAVDEVGFEIRRGETLALVGESGSGKSTTARLVLRLSEPQAGRIVLDGEDVTRHRGERLRLLRRRVQLIHQNPASSFDPRLSVLDVVTEPLRAFGIGDRAARAERARELLEQVALPASALRRRPAELSGGQNQRVAIARALAVSPELIVCDEPVSALDVSVRARVLDLLAALQEETGVAYLFITHDLAVVKRIAHRVAVMRTGRIVETGTAQAVFDDPRHEHTRALLAAIPGARLDRTPDPTHR
ncbi:ABC transporter ATP-binding protein [Actinocorallia sp. API 0066]|uniref:dipeptide ABC transporter ATP-binding protein n=1 Tax=Actinocorallia sp. API 0066 TaxID=2896846 RepID=UPI001E354F64|nr:ABC transporter ATP-binding protein [Actinocorallia sp. API 0066]MCD0450918.1 ABC transporter ATP-binding protein [Actinocorallia sp. API 0066]